MSKAQTDIRTTSYDAANANPEGFQGTLDDARMQAAREIDTGSDPTYTRYELLAFLGVDKIPSAGPSVELDENPRYGDEPSTEPGFYSLEYALKNFPGSFLHRTLLERLAALSESQQLVFRMWRTTGHDVRYSLDRAEAYPYPAKLGH
jgi:hypothetical protein